MHQYRARTPGHNLTDSTPHIRQPVNRPDSYTMIHRNNNSTPGIAINYPLKPYLLANHNNISNYKNLPKQPHANGTFKFPQTADRFSIQIRAPVNLSKPKHNARKKHNSPEID
jgi:hypothetical protein